MPTRRALLSTTLAGAATAAGCAVPAPFSNPSPALLRRWSPDPATVQPAAHGTLFYLDWPAVAGVRSDLADGTYRKYRNYARFLDVGRLGIRPGDVADLLQVYPPASSPRRAAVARADVDADRLRERLAGRYDGRARRRGFEVFWRAGGDGAGGDGAGSAAATASAADADAGPVEWGGRPVAAATDGRHLVLGAPTPSLSARAVVERVVDVRAGAAARYAAASKGLRVVLDALGGGDDVSASTYDPVPAADAAPEHARFAGAVATGHRYRFRGATTRSRYAFAFAGSEGTGDGEAATDDGAPAATAETAVDAVRRWVDAHRDGRLFGAYRSVTVARRGRAVVVDGDVPTGAV